MSTATPPASTPQVMLWIGRVISVLPVLGLVMSAYMKFSRNPELVKGLTHFGYPLEVAVPLGIVELTCTILYVIPQTSVLGAILLTGYLGGAIATHVRVEEGFGPPLFMGVLLWLGLFLRDARIRALVPWRRTPQA